MDIISITNQFVDFYYDTFSRNREELNTLYRDDSTLSYEGNAYLGVNNIIQKYKSLPFKKITWTVTTRDPLPSSVEGSIIILVTGQLRVDDEPNPIHFCQTFNLTHESGTFYVSNDLFRLNYG